MKAIPSLKKDNNNVYYTQIGMCIYIALEDIKNDIVFIYILEQEIEKNTVKIKNVYSNTIVKKSNILERFFKYNKEFESYNLKTRLINLINDIEVIVDKEYLSSKVLEYLNNSEEEAEDLIKVIKEDGQIKIVDNINKVNKPKLNFKKKDKKHGGLRSPKEIICNGKVYETLNSFCTKHHLPATSVWQMINKQGLTPEEVLKRYETKGQGNRITVKPKKSNKARKRYTYLGEELTMSELANISGLATSTLNDRINKLGWSVERAVETPPKKINQKEMSN